MPSFTISSGESAADKFYMERGEDMSEYFNVADIFGEDVFTDKVMQERLPKKVYKALKKTIEEGK